MSSEQEEGGVKTGAIQYYMDIINSIPDAVYWTDANCQLIGCNLNFLQLFNIKNPQDLKESPYDLMKNWPAERLETLKLDDMNIIFSGEPRYNVEEKIHTDGKTLYFKINRVPMFNEQRQVIGLVVVLTNINELYLVQEELKKYQPKKETKAVDIPLNDHLFPKILMIEDNIIAQNVERAMFAALNCEVDIADTGDKAMELFVPGKYDLVLMDIGLEDTSGYVVAKNLRNMEKDTSHHVPIIALTSYEAEVVKYDCKQYRMEGVVSKPLTSQQAELIVKHYVYHLDVEVPGLKSL